MIYKMYFLVLQNRNFLGKKEQPYTMTTTIGFTPKFIHIYKFVMSKTDTYRGVSRRGRQRVLRYCQPPFQISDAFLAVIDHQPHLTFLVCRVVFEFAWFVWFWVDMEWLFIPLHTPLQRGKKCVRTSNRYWWKRIYSWTRRVKFNFISG